MELKKIFNKKTIVMLSVVIGLIALYYIYKEISIREIINTFRYATLENIAMYVVVQVLMFLILSYRWKVILKSQGINNVGLLTLTNYKIVGYAVSFLTPTAKIGGEPVRAGLLSTREKIPFKKALSSVVIDKTLELTTSALFFILGGIFLLMQFVIDPRLRNVIIAVIIFFIIVFGIFNYRMLRGKSFFHKLFIVLKLNKIKGMKKFSRKLKEFENLVIKFYHEDRKYFFYSIIVSFVSWILMFFEFQIAGEIVGQSLTPMQVFLVFSFIGVAYLVPIPMALGALEAGQISVFGLIKIKAAAGVGLSLIVRLKDMLFAAYGIILLAIYGLKLKEVVKESKTIDKEVERLEVVEKYGDKK